MDREQHRDRGGDLAEALDRRPEQVPVDERGPVQRDEQVGAGLDVVLAAGAQVAEPILEGDERVDHRVADEADPVGRHPLVREVGLGLGRVREEQVGDLIDQDPVDLLRHRPVEAPQPGLDVGERDAQVGAGESGGKGRVDVAGDDHEVRRLRLEDRPDPLEDGGEHRRVRSGPDAEHVIGLRHPELLEEDARHHPVVVLTGVDQYVVAVRVGAPQGGDHRRHLDEVRARPDYVQQPHGAPLKRWCRSARRARSRPASGRPPSAS